MKIISPILLGLGMLCLYAAAGTGDFHDMLVVEVGTVAAGSYPWLRVGGLITLGLAALAVGVWGMMNRPRSNYRFRRHRNFGLRPRRW